MKYSAFSFSTNNFLFSLTVDCLFVNIHRDIAGVSHQLTMARKPNKLCIHKSNWQSGLTSLFGSLFKSSNAVINTYTYSSCEIRCSPSVMSIITDTPHYAKNLFFITVDQTLTVEKNFTEVLTHGESYTSSLLIDYKLELSYNSSNLHLFFVILGALLSIINSMPPWDERFL